MKTLKLFYVNSILFNAYLGVIMAKHLVVKRIPIGLEWTLGEVWFGYRLPSVHCECCIGIGTVNWEIETASDRDRQMGARQRRTCPICNGEGNVQPIIEIPSGSGFQLWGTYNYKTGVDEHHYFPISPEFKSAFELAEWMAKTFTINGDPLTSEQTWYDAIQDNNVDVVFGLYKATHEHFENF